MEMVTLAGKRGMRRRRGSLGKEWRVFLLLVRGFRIELAARRGWGYSVWQWTRPNGRTVRPWDADCYQEMVDMRKKRAVSEAPRAKHLAGVETNIFKDMMPIVEHMAVTQYDDGDSRKPGWITLRTFGSVWQIEVKDPDTLQMMRVAQPSLDDALILLSLLLSSEDAPWEPDTWAMAQVKKSKK